MFSRAQLSEPFIKRYQQYPFDSQKDAADYLKNICKNAGYGLVLGLAKYAFAEINETFLNGNYVIDSWAKNLIWEPTLTALATETVGPLAFHAIRKANEGLNAASRFLGLQTTIELPKEAGSMVAVAVMTGVVLEKVSQKQNIYSIFVNGVLLPDMLRSLHNQKMLLPVKA